MNANFLALPCIIRSFEQRRKNYKHIASAQFLMGKNSLCMEKPSQSFLDVEMIHPEVTL